MKRFILMTVCVLGMFVVHGVSAVTPSIKDGNSINISSDYTYNVGVVCASDVVYTMETQAENINSNWVVVDNSINITPLEKAIENHVSINVNRKSVLPDGYLKPPRNAKIELQNYVIYLTSVKSYGTGIGGIAYKHYSNSYCV